MEMPPRRGRAARLVVKWVVGIGLVRRKEKGAIPAPCHSYLSGWEGVVSSTIQPSSLVVARCYAAAGGYGPDL